MFNQQQFYGMNNGYNYGRPLEVPRMQQGLSAKEQEFLRSQAANQFSFTAVTDEDLIKAKCTHKFNNTWDVESLDPSTGLVECRTCHERFHLVDLEPDEAEKIVDNMIDMLQTAKYMYVDIKPELASQFFQIIPLVKQAGKIYTLAMQNISKYDGNYNLNQNNDQYAFQALSGLMTGSGYPGYGPAPGYGYGYGGQQMQQAPTMPADQGNPFYGQQAPMYGTPAPNMGAPGYGYAPQAPGYGYAPQAPGYGYPQQQMNMNTNQAPAQPQSTTTADAAKDVQVNKTYNK